MLSFVFYSASGQTCWHERDVGCVGRRGSRGVGEEEGKWNVSVEVSIETSVVELGSSKQDILDSLSLVSFPPPSLLVSVISSSMLLSEYLREDGLSRPNSLPITFALFSPRASSLSLVSIVHPSFGQRLTRSSPLSGMLALSLSLYLMIVHPSFGQRLTRSSPLSAP